MQKSLGNININSLDLGRYSTVISAGTTFFRVVELGRDPLVPSGKESRFAKEPTQYPGPEKFASLYAQGSASVVGTGNICVAHNYYVAVQESDAKNPVGYKLTLNTQIDAVDMDSICSAEGVSKPYITEDRDGIWHEFYGKRVKALRYESLKNKGEYNLVLFPDWIPNFNSIFVVERINQTQAIE